MIYVLACCLSEWLAERWVPFQKALIWRLTAFLPDPHVLFLQFLKKGYLGSGYLLWWAWPCWSACQSVRAIELVLLEWMSQHRHIEKGAAAASKKKTCAFEMVVLRAVGLRCVLVLICSASLKVSSRRMVQKANLFKLYMTGMSWNLRLGFPHPCILITNVSYSFNGPRWRESSGTLKT